MEIVHIQDIIYELRNEKVILDFDLAVLYEIETKALNQAVKRNHNRFPNDFMFRLTVEEWQNLMRSQNVTASQAKRNIKITPFAFTEHGVAMLASVLKSDKAVKMNISIVRAFIALRQFTINYQTLSKEIIELKNIAASHNIQLNEIYSAIENLLDEKVERKSWEERERIGFKTK